MNNADIVSKIIDIAFTIVLHLWAWFVAYLTTMVLLKTNKLLDKKLNKGESDEN